MRRRAPGLKRYVRRRLHRRIFVWFGASIFVTGLAVAAVAAVLTDGGETSWRKEIERLHRFTAGRFEEVWDLPERRDTLMRAVAEDLEVKVALLDPQGGLIAGERALGHCKGPRMHVPVDRGRQRLGSIEICAERRRGGGAFAASMIVAGLVLWGASGRIARRLTRPLGDLVKVAEEIGAGRLSARAPTGCHTTDEIGVLADAINEMAGRIERQLGDQRVLLAAVSHELRTPLGHLRILSELVRQQGAAGKLIDEIDAEIVEIDGLVGELLASSRLDFTALSPQRLDAGDVARRALERAGLDPSILEVEGGPIAFEADPTLVARALANVLDNAIKHAGSVARLVVRSRQGRIAFAVEDRGPGLRPGDEAKVFEPFYRRQDGSGGKESLGLGLALVRRIAEAHGGRAYAENNAAGGAKVTLELAAAA